MRLGKWYAFGHLHDDKDEMVSNAEMTTVFTWIGSLNPSFQIILLCGLDGFSISFVVLVAFLSHLPKNI